MIAEKRATKIPSIKKLSPLTFIKLGLTLKAKKLVFWLTDYVIEFLTAWATLNHALLIGRKILKNVVEF
jgi:hypothetical protein